LSLIAVANLRKTLGGRALLDGVSFTLGEGERVGLVGPNGCGKSTLLRILAGAEPADDGSVTLRRGLRLGWLEQDPALDPALSVRDAVRAGLAGRDAVLAGLAAVHAGLEHADDVRLPALLALQERLEQELDALGGHDVEHRVEATLQSLDLSRFDAACGTLSGGERRRVALARLILAGPELLLLDEPTNHLDAFVTDWLEDWFLETRTPLLLVTHDRYFLDRVVDRILELDRGELWGCEGGYAEYLEARAERMASEAHAESARLNLLRRETAWIRRGPPARTTKPRARIHRWEKLVADAPPPASADLELALPPGPRLGTRVLVAHGISKRFGGRVVVPPLDLEIGAGTRLGIVGPNGAGKSTLLGLLTGRIPPDSGRVETGETVRFMGIDQQRSALDLSSTAAQTVAGRSDVVWVDGRSQRVEGFLERFGFPVQRQQTLVSNLSGGERSRLLLATLLCAGGNVLVLDEPTNDLDLLTLRALEEALLAFPGAALLVSHDRWFLDRVATHILHLDGHGGARLATGDLSSLLARLKAEAAAARGARPAEVTSAPAPAPAPASAKRRRLAPWQARELGLVEARIPAAEAALATLDARLADPALYAGPAVERERVQAARAAAADEVARLYARWEQLESLRAGLAGAD